MHVAVDVSAYGARDGIGRYVTSLLDRLRASPGRVTHWSFYGVGDVSALAGPDVRNLRALPGPRAIARIATLATSLPWWLARDRPDVFWAPAHRLPLWLPRRVARVATLHDLCFRVEPSTMRPVTRCLDAMLVPRTIAAADRLVVNSEATAATLHAHWPEAASRTLVSPLGASPLPAPAGRQALADLGIGGRYVLFVGTLEPRKNLPRLLAAFAALPPEAREGVQLVIAGARGWGPDLTPALHAPGVLWLGAVDDSQLATLYRYAEFLAMPSLYEGFGLPVVESLAHGTPVLVADVASLPEVAGAAGLRVPPRDVDALRAALQRLLSDAALRAELATHAHAQAARFTWDAAARVMLHAFDEALRTRR